MKRALIVCSVVALAGCAAEPTREQSLVNRAADAMGGAERLAGIKTVSARGTTKQWEPEQSDVPGGEMRFANETSFTVMLGLPAFHVAAVSLYSVNEPPTAIGCGAA